MAIIVGIVFIVAGLMGFLRWFQEFVFVAKGLGPVVLLASGVLAVVVGIASLGSRRGDGKS
jgi:hypothetical protein